MYPEHQKLADDAFAAHMQAAASGQFLEYWEQQAKAAAERLGQTDTDDTDPIPSGGDSRQDSNWSAGDSDSGARGGLGGSSEDAAREREESP